MSKDRLRGITLVRGPIWGIHSLTLIISCLKYDAVVDFDKIDNSVRILLESTKESVTVKKKVSLLKRNVQNATNRNQKMHIFLSLSITDF